MQRGLFSFSVECRPDPPASLSKYKKREGANELSIKLLDRIVEMASEEGDIVFDPFGGSGTTYA
ncbi:MAG: site-specific DNA-methyltransferase, partial [Geobacteraceae bacterium]|nr:site-specific DNA-methyltransferase [Geobacteraceae bacterium]